MKSWPKLDGALADYVDANWLRESPLKRRLREETAKLPQAGILADKMPKPSDVLANAYDFAEQLLASQRKFAEDVLQATAPVLAGQGSASASKA